MPEELVKIFISYTRIDSAFVDRLQADLQIRNYDVWVDRQKLEGGQNWSDSIEKAIERAQVVLVTLTPDAITSEWVKREYSFAQELRKHIIPLQLLS